MIYNDYKIKRIIVTVMAVVCLISGCIPVNDFNSIEYGKQMDDALESCGFVGNILIADSEGILYEKALGDIPIIGLYEVGSITQQFTAAAIISLEKEGKLSLEDKLSKYFSDAGWMGECTIRDLVNMNTRIPDYTDKADFALITDKEKLTNEILSYQQAGEITGNSRSNYYLLGLIIERISGVTYEEYVTKHVIEPMGFKNTVVKQTDYKSFATEGVYSNVYDMYHWNNAFFGGEILSENSQSDFESHKYTWMCGLNLKDGIYYGGNQTQMYSTYMVYEEGTYIIMLTDKFNPEIVSYGEEVYELTMEYIK